MSEHDPDPSIDTRTYLPVLMLCRTCRRSITAIERYTVLIGDRAESGYCRDCAAKLVPALDRAVAS